MPRSVNTPICAFDVDNLRPSVNVNRTGAVSPTVTATLPAWSHCRTVRRCRLTMPTISGVIEPSPSGSGLPGCWSVQRITSRSRLASVDEPPPATNSGRSAWIPALSLRPGSGRFGQWRGWCVDSIFFRTNGRSMGLDAGSVSKTLSGTRGQFWPWFQNSGRPLVTGLTMLVMSTAQSLLQHTGAMAMQRIKSSRPS